MKIELMLELLLTTVLVTLRSSAEAITPQYEEQLNSSSSWKAHGGDVYSSMSNKIISTYSQHQCQLYLAKSSIYKAGNGVYTTKSYKQGDTFGGTEMLITLNASGLEERISDALWGVHVDLRLSYESTDPSEVGVYTPGFGTINCHFGLLNVNFAYPSYNSAGLHRSRDPGAGAFTYWHNMSLIATRDISAGEELFMNYGSDFFDDRKHYMSAIPRKKDYHRADRLVQRVRSIHERNPTSNSTKHALIGEEFWSIARNWITMPEVAKALPETYGELKDVRTYGTARHSVGGPSSLRSQQWLQKNGLCVDNMYVDKSTIPQAGRGAFASRFLSKGSIVSPAPVLQVHRNSLIDELTGFQLLLNYAFGHPNSPMFLIPYGSMVSFINHDSQSPNVELRWSTSKTLHNRRDLLELSYKEVIGSEFGLLMEFVALRDIQPHEEILLNYGDKWEQAWLNHLDSWEPIPGAESYMSAEDAIEEMGILTMDEQKLNPYPDNLQTACYVSFSDDAYFDEDKEYNDTRWVIWNASRYDCLRWCSILERVEKVHDVSDDEEGVEYYYNALILPQDGNLCEECIVSNDEIIHMLEIPSSAVTVVDQTLSRDQYIPNTFRHYIQLSDDLYPEVWRVNRSVCESQYVKGNDCDLENKIM
jgi:hypothetical protein